MRRFLLLLSLSVSVFGQTKLEDLERMALASSPSLQQASAQIRVAAGRAKQAGLYPNPIFGATGDHNTPALNGGSLGGFAEQRIVTGGKLGLDQKTADEDRLTAEEMARAERLRVLAEIRTLYYRGLGEQRLLDVRKRMAELAERTAGVSRELKNVGQADQPNVLEAEIEAQRAQLGATMAENALARTWREIGEMTGLKRSTLEGDLETLPALDSEAELARILRESPRIRAAEIDAARSALVLRRAKAEVIPDIVARGGIRYNRELLPYPVGPEGYFDVGVSVPLFNRNQGAREAANADQERARAQAAKERLELTRQFASLYREYADATAAAVRYRDELLPKARQGFEMFQASFRQMAAAYPNVLSSQRTLIQMEEEYIEQLVTAWRAKVEIEAL